MMHVYEFEVFDSDKMKLAFPYDMQGGTQGKDLKQVCENAADWLQTTMEHMALNKIPFPKATFGNKPHNGGQNIIVAVNAGLDTIRRITPAEAARRLGITRSRVSQMIDANLLETFELDGRKWVTENSVNARLKEAPKAGRPKKPLPA